MSGQSPPTGAITYFEKSIAAAEGDYMARTIELLLAYRELDRFRPETE